MDVDLILEAAVLMDKKANGISNNQLTSESPETSSNGLGTFFYFFSIIGYCSIMMHVMCMYIVPYVALCCIVKTLLAMIVVYISFV